MSHQPKMKEPIRLQEILTLLQLRVFQSSRENFYITHRHANKEGEENEKEENEREDVEEEEEEEEEEEKNKTEKAEEEEREERRLRFVISNLQPFEYKNILD
ncbi:hypothetical protein M8J77_008652 [Diaphorina citri]|nr:hypothetical protein M8J77_008652 [Diaphorina citri]